MVALVALIFNFGLNLFLIPYFQHVGAAIMTSLTELLIVCLQITFIPRHLLPLKSLVVGGKALVACLVMGGAIWLLDRSNILTTLPVMHSLSVFVVLAVAMLTYLGATTLLRTIPREDLLTLYRAIRKKAEPAASLSSQEVAANAAMD